MRCYTLASARQNLHQVTSLILDALDLEQIPSEVYEMAQLETLDLRRNKLSTIPVDINRLKSLKTLLLGANQLQALPEQLPNLLHLDISKNRFVRFPEVLCQLKQLQKVNLSSNRISTIPALFFLTLKELALTGNRLKSFHFDQTHFPKIEKLHLAQNRLVEISINGEFPHLGTLDLSHNQLAHLPDHFDHMPFLRLLYVNNNRLSILPDSLKYCLWLKELNVAKNKFSILPEFCSWFERLEEVSLAGNTFSQFPPLPRTLRKLNFAHNQLEGLPQHFFQKNTLRSLDLSYNPLKSWRGLETSQHLETLTLSRLNPPDAAKVFLKLPKVPKVKGVSGEVFWKKLLPFSRACLRKNIAEPERQLLWQAFEEKISLTQLPLDLLLQGIALGASPAQQRLLHHLFQVRSLPADLKQIHAGSTLAIIGRSTQTREELQSRFAQKGLMLKKPEQALYWVLTRPPFPEKPPSDKGVTWLNETQLEQLLSPEAPVFDALELDNLQRLLLHPDPLNVRLAAQLLNHSSVQDKVLPYLYLAWRWTKEEKLRRELRALLERNWPPEQKHLLRLRASFHREMPPDLLRQRLKEVLGALVGALEENH